MSSINATAVPSGKSRGVAKAVLAVETPEGDGARVRRSIGTAQLRNLSPFLMLDHMISCGSGFPEHPHAGFSTVTYLLEGAMEHEDFTGSQGILNPGDLQWMTAGKGIIHSEMPVYTKDGPDPVGLQLWVDLPKQFKGIEPNYQDLKADKIPTVALDNGARIKVISGESHGVSGPIQSFGGCHFYDIQLPAGAQVFQALPKGWTAFAYIIDGTPVFGVGAGAEKIDRYHTVVLDSDGEGVEIANGGDKETRMVLIAGEPLNQPVVQYGPFVATTRSEIMDLFQDFQARRNGFEKAATWKSKISYPRQPLRRVAA